MRVKYNYLHEQFREPDEYFEDLRDLVKSAEFTLGPFVERFERRFADYLGARHAISTNTGTDALILSLKACRVKAGDEVITVPNTFVATVGAIVACGARPVFIDVDERYQMDPRLLERAITRRTKAILPVHWTGAPCDIVEIMAIAEKNGIPVVEDACAAVGAKVHGRFVGTFGRVNAFSMHPLKPLNVWGDGGVIVTNDDEAASFLRLYRKHGLADRDHVEIWGVNCRLQPVQAVVANRLLDRLERDIELRLRNQRRLDGGLKDLRDFILTPRRPAGYREVVQIYVARAQRRDELMRFLAEKEIESRIHYSVPLHLQRAAASLGYRKGDFPVCERQAAEIITIPAHPYIHEEEIDTIVESIRQFYQPVVSHGLERSYSG